MSRRIDHFTHHSQTNAHNAQHTALLQDIVTNTGNIKIEAETIDINVADLEVLQTAANGLLTTANSNTAHISDNLDHLSSNIDQVNVNLGVLALIDGELEGMTPLLTTANSNTAHISDNLDHISSNLDTINANLNPALNNIEAELEEHKPIHEATNTKLDTINATLTGGGVVNITTLATHAKQDTINGSVLSLGTPLAAALVNTASTNTKLDTINTTLGDLATESTLQIISEFNCDTTDVTISSSALPSGAATSALQGTTNTKLDSLISANHTDIVNTKDRIDVLITANHTDLAHISDNLDHLSGDLDTLEHSVNALEGKQDDTITAINQNKTQVNALITANHNDIIATKDRIDFLITQQSADLHLQHDKTDHLSGDLDTLEHSVNALEGKQDDTITAINQNKTQVNALITANHTDIIATKDRIDFLISQQSADLHLQHDKTDHLSANLDTLDASLSTANGHLNALAAVVNPAIATATATTIPNKLDIIETTADAILAKNTQLETLITQLDVVADASLVKHTNNETLLTQLDVVADASLVKLTNVETLITTLDGVADNILTKQTLHTTSELKELLSGVTLSLGNLSSEFDFENYRHARFFGITTASVGTDIIVMGSNTSGGTYYVMGENLRSDTIGSTHYIYSPVIENLPRYIKIYNKSGSTNYIFTKLYIQLSEGRVAV